tara:strand:- start:756 stop:1544 length:789 start_codon:yes stop_codon:yes gene_type:complete
MIGKRFEFLNNGRSIFIGEGTGREDENADNQNTAIDHNAMFNDSLLGKQNVAVGESTLLELKSGERNTAVGQSAMRRLSTGSYNTAVGEDSLYGNIVRNNNTAIGRHAGENIFGDGGVYIGYRAGRHETGSNKLYIDNSDTASPLIYGEFDNNLIIINGTYEVTSDINLKSDIEELSGVLPQVLSLQGNKYKRKNIKDSEKREIGVIAQDIQKIFPELVGSNKEGYLSVNYTGLVPVLIEAMKEQQQQINNLSKRLNSIDNK